MPRRDKQCKNPAVIKALDKLIKNLVGGLSSLQTVYNPDTFEALTMFCAADGLAAVPCELNALKQVLVTMGAVLGMDGGRRMDVIEKALEHPEEPQHPAMVAKAAAVLLDQFLDRLAIKIT